MEKDDKDGFEDLIARLGILEGIFDLRLPQEDVPPASSPKHLLEGRQSLPEDHSGHKTKLKSSSCASFILQVILLFILDCQFFVLWLIICLKASLIIKLTFIKSYFMLSLVF